MDRAKKDLRKSIDKNKLYSITLPLLLMLLKYDINFSNNRFIEEEKARLLNNIHTNFNIDNKRKSDVLVPKVLVYKYLIGVRTI